MTRRKSRRWLTVPEILEELGISRRTWQRWMKLGRTPKHMVKMPSGRYRVAEDDYLAWLRELEVDA